MNAKRYFSNVLLVASLVSSALPAAAGTVQFQTTLSAFRNNNIGTTTTVGPTHTDHFCYLSTVTMQNTDTSGETATCRVVRSGAVWLLEATLGRNDDADVSCSATCYRIVP
jgi:hypothetical protein